MISDPILFIFVDTIQKPINAITICTVTIKDYM